MEYPELNTIYGELHIIYHVQIDIVDSLSLLAIYEFPQRHSSVIGYDDNIYPESHGATRSTEHYCNEDTPHC